MPVMRLCIFLLVFILLAIDVKAELYHSENENAKTKYEHNLNNDMIKFTVIQPEMIFRHFNRNQLSISAECRESLLVMLKTSKKDSTKLDHIKSWAFQISDSFGKPPDADSLITKNNHYKGSADLCITTFENREKNGVSGKFCVASVFGKHQTIQENSTIKQISLSTPKTFWGTCLPTTCTLSDRDILLNNFKAEEKYCQTAEQHQIDVTAIILTIIIISIIGLVIIATLIDFKQRINQSPEKIESSNNSGKRQSLVHILSIKTSIESLFETDETSTVNYLSGARVILLFVFIISQLQSAELNPILKKKNQADNLKVIKMPFMSLISYSYLYVNLLFFFNGVLLSCIVFNGWSQLKTASQIFEFHNTKIFRRTLPYMFMLIIVAGPYAYIYESNLWPLFLINQRECRSHWFKKLLQMPQVAGNPMETSCIINEWYIVMDIQANGVIAILVLLLNKRPKIGLTMIAAVIFSSTVALAILIGNYEVDPFTTISTALHNNILITDYQLYMERHVWYRLSSSCIGVLVGYIVSQNSEVFDLKLRHGWICCLSIWSVSELFCYVYVDGEQMPKWVQVVYGTVGNLLWSATATWIVSQFYSHQSSNWSWFLNNKWLNALGKMWYSIFLCHGVVIQVFLLVKEQRPPSYFNKSLDSLEVALTSTALAFVLYCIVESPTHQMSKKLFKGKGFPGSIII